MRIIKAQEIVNSKRKEFIYYFIAEEFKYSFLDSLMNEIKRRIIGDVLRVSIDVNFIGVIKRISDENLVKVDIKILEVD